MDTFRVEIPQNDLWRVAEARLNAFPQFVLEIDGQSIHFVHVHVRGERQDALPLLLIHG
jgi:hypothetical protein